MLEELERAERELPALISSSRWSSLDVDYEPPRVERLWTQLDGLRVYLHRIHPCDSALFHPHPWPSAVKVVSGRYEMAVGHGPAESPPPAAAKLVLAAGSSYEMTDPDGWHYVRPIGGPSLSVMVTGAPWKRWSPGKGRDLRPLSATDAGRLLDDFRKLYPV